MLLQKKDKKTYFITRDNENGTYTLRSMDKNIFGKEIETNRDLNHFMPNYSLEIYSNKGLITKSNNDGKSRLQRRKYRNDYIGKKLVGFFA